MFVLNNVCTFATEQQENSMTEKERRRCHYIIHTNATAAAGIAAGLAQLPGVDSAPLAALEVEMVTALGAVFDIKVSSAAAKGVIASVAGTAVGRATSQFLLGWIPGLGNAINASTAAGIVEALGWLAADHFDLEKQAKLLE